MYGYENMPGWGGWGGMWFGPLPLIIVLILVVAVIIWLVRGSAGGASGTRHVASVGKPTAMEILEERFAKGEIDQEEFEQSRRVLKNQTGAGQ